MANNRTSIEIEAKGEFSQLTRGLREVKSALGEVTRVVNTGARSGGFFSDEQVKSLDIFSRRFDGSMGRMNRLIDEQAEKIVALYGRRKTASQMDITTIDKEIKKHGQYLDNLEKERTELEKIFNLRRQESSTFGSKPVRVPGGGGGKTPPAPGGTPVRVPGGGGGKTAPVPGGTNPLEVMGKNIKGVGSIIATLAGVSMTIGQLIKWEQMAEHNIKSWQPLTQRTGMDRTATTQTGLGRGYSSSETQQMLDVYTQTAGNISQKDAGRMMDFSRGYGVDANTTAGIAGQMSVRGYGGAGQVLDNVAGVASSSGMEARVLEVLETSSGFLQSMDKNLKDNGGNSLLAYTARINQVGKEQGASKLTGQAGASLLEQMGGNIFNPSNVRWQAMGINMLKKDGGDATKNMNTFDLMSKWQEGFKDPINIKVLAKFLADGTKGMNEKQAQERKTLIMQEAMGGNTTIEQASQFGDMTNWLQKFSPDDPKMKELLAGGNGVAAQSQVDQKSTQWQATIDAKIQVTNAKWDWAQIQAGEVVIPAKLALQDFSTDMLTQMTDALNKLDIGNIIGKKIRDALSQPLWAVIGEIAGGMIATKVAGSLLKKLGAKGWEALTGKKPPGGGAGPNIPGGGAGLDVPGVKPGDVLETPKILGPDGKPLAPSAPEVKPTAGLETPKTTAKMPTFGRTALKFGKNILKAGAEGVVFAGADMATDPLQEMIGNLTMGKQGELSQSDRVKHGVFDDNLKWITSQNQLNEASPTYYQRDKRYWDQLQGQGDTGRLSELKKQYGNAYDATKPMDQQLDQKPYEKPARHWGQGALDFATGGNPDAPGNFKSGDFSDYWKTYKVQMEARDGTIKAQNEALDSTLSTNKDVKTSIDGMVSDAAKTFTGMKTDSLSAFDKMQKAIEDMSKSVSAMAALNGGGGGNTVPQDSSWFSKFSMKDPSTWFNFGGDKQKTPPKGEVQQQVLDELKNQGHESWWPDVQKLMGHENAAWDPNPKPNPIGVGKNSEHAQGLFQFLPSTWKGQMPDWAGSTPGDASVPLQTDGLIRYMNERYKGDFSNIKNFDQPNGNGPNDYKGYANGTYSAVDQIANIHAGEELISRPKTSEVQRKTGLLPSQVLNQYMSGGGSMDAPRGAQAASTGGIRRVVVDVNMNGAEALSGVSVAMIEQIARQTFTDAAHQAMREQVQY